MPFATLHRIASSELVAMAKGELENSLTDVDFLETLAAKKCFLIPPWILMARADGSLVKITRVRYTVDGTLDKARMLLEVARELRRQKMLKSIGRRFSV